MGGKSEMVDFLKENMPKKIDRFVDLFAGAGGLSEGFTATGFHPVSHVEMNAEGVVTSFKTPLLPIQTSLYGQELQMELSYATDIYRDESVNIQVLDYFEEDGNATLVLNVENLSSMMLDFESRGSWFDGKDVGYANRQLAPGYKSVMKLTVYEKKRIEYGIEAPIHDIVLQLRYTLDRQDKVDIDPIRLTVG